MHRPVKVAVRRGVVGYVAYVPQDGDVYAGASPDEALGYAIREHWLNGTFDRPITLELDIASDTLTPESPQT